VTRLRSPVAYATIGSLAVHGVVAAWLLTRPALEPKREQLEPIEFAFYEPPAPAPATAALSVEQDSTTELEQLAQRARSKSARRAPANTVAVPPADEATAPVTPHQPEAQETVPSPSERETRVTKPPSVRAIDLSPLAAALTMVDPFGAPGSCAALRGSDAGCGPGVAKQLSAPTIARGPRVGTRSMDELDLKHEADGSLSYNGPAFVARIAPDGRVHFEDKIQDLNTLVERHLVGAQINTSEKRRFIESTAALREELATRSEARNQVSAAAALRAKLVSVLASGTLSLAQKRSTLFELWDSCASDDSGNAAQATIESFIRARLPEDSPLAYSSAELAQLNRRRVSRRVFDPYGSADAGALPS
jgi:hypothetical protein